ncbi:MAG TPA: excinuclease ABC subunit UvrC [Dissulfurispiraceae bacterium]|nr:excinuclease ABC subunit UvrC [Dissulfurispiraceae bacterium]
MQPDLSKVPTNPGVYIFKDRKEKILYVGKAKNLRNRLRSYFQNSSGLDARKARMVSLVRDFSFIATGNELEAFILEATLIKRHKPPFNIVLRDDKSYPYLEITMSDPWPCIQVVRRIRRDGNRYFGPYVPAQAMWEALDFIRRTFPIRTCKHALDTPMRPCVQHQIKRCSAPCAGLISRDDYLKVVDDVILFLRGEKQGLLDRLEQRMQELSNALQFEEAAAVRDRLALLRKAFEAQKVVAPELGDLDVVGFAAEGTGEPYRAAVEILFVRGGVLIGSRDYVIDKPVSRDEPEILRDVLQNFYAKDILPPPLITADVMPDSSDVLSAWLLQRRGEPVAVESPKKGKKRDLVDMANENAGFALERKRRRIAEDLPAELQERLALHAMPKTIGAFDVSTIQGSDSVGAFVYAEHGKFRKDLYRHLRITEVAGVDDYAMMKETIERTLLNLDEQIPDLLIVDGGRGQLDVARRVLRDLAIDRDLVSLAKKPDRVFLTDDNVVPIDDASRSSLFLRRIRDEVHRFAISYHRKLRDKRLSESVLEGIRGVGPGRRLELLRHFGSLDGIRTASADDIMKVRGITRPIAESILLEINRKESPE